MGKSRKPEGVSAAGQRNYTMSCSSVRSQRKWFERFTIQSGKWTEAGERSDREEPDDTNDVGGDGEGAGSFGRRGKVRGKGGERTGAVLPFRSEERDLPNEKARRAIARLPTEMGREDRERGSCCARYGGSQRRMTTTRRGGRTRTAIKRHSTASGYFNRGQLSSTIINFYFFVGAGTYTQPPQQKLCPHSM